jgi:DNA-binding response OmpR family regulator
MTKQLEANGFSVITANNGLDGLMVLEKDKPDAIVCDVSMPELDGLEFVRGLKGRDETRHIPVIFVTGNQDPGQMVDGINVGARYYLTKPFDMNELIWKVKRVISDKRR